jgi:hypothetical protein
MIDNPDRVGRGYRKDYTVNRRLCHGYVIFYGLCSVPSNRLTVVGFFPDRNTACYFLRTMEGGYHRGMSPGLTRMVPGDLHRYVPGTYLYGTERLTWV